MEETVHRDDGGGGEQYDDAPSAEPPEQASGVVSTRQCLEDVSGMEPAEVRIREPENAPEYEVLNQSETEAGRLFEVATGAGSREELRAIAEKLRYENQGQDAISVDFYGEGPGDEREDAGIAMVFNTREAACRAFQYPPEEQDALISEDNGVSVLSVEEGV